MKLRCEIIELIQYVYYVDMLVEDLAAKILETIDQLNEELTQITAQTMDYQTDSP